jgi:hypothetical protein
MLAEIVLSNAAIATLLALIAAVVGRYCHRPQLVYALWLLVLLKLVSPPLLHVPIPLAIEPHDELSSREASHEQPRLLLTAENESVTSLQLERSDPMPSALPINLDIRSAKDTDAETTAPAVSEAPLLITSSETNTTALTSYCS